MGAVCLFICIFFVRQAAVMMLFSSAADSNRVLSCASRIKSLSNIFGFVFGVANGVRVAIRSNENCGTN